jgi:hypothetical protein
MGPQSHFEVLVKKEQAALLQALLSADSSDSHQHANLKGRHMGLDKALELYRKAMRLDDEEEP